jgi:transitional endoplasmic reticulum ATPase
VHEVSSWSLTLRGEIWSFNSPGEWLKDKALYQSIQTARWADIILDEGMKRTVKEDVEGFFKKQHVYRDLGVPWKRGAIFKGPAGNGKTISLKALMRDTLREGIPTLYVRTFNRWGSDLEGLKAIFKKARSQAPCLVIIEDIDSLITE